MLRRLTAVALAAAVIAPAGAAADGFGGLLPAGAAPAAPVPAPAGPFTGLHRERIPTAFGPRRSGPRYWVSLADVPSDVPQARWRVLARVAGRRWGMRAIADVRRRVVFGDGYPEVGFGPGVPAGALAVTRTLYVVRYRVRRHCSPLSGHCVILSRRVLSRQLFDRDVLIRPDVPWQAGPAKPDLLHYDLESVLLHEMGHMAGNRHHAPRCQPSPMVIAVAPGEWWHAPGDFSYRGCTGEGAPPSTLGDADASTKLVAVTRVLRG